MCQGGQVYYGSAFINLHTCVLTFELKTLTDVQQWHPSVNSLPKMLLHI